MAKRSAARAPAPQRLSAGQVSAAARAFELFLAKAVDIEGVGVERAQALDQALRATDSVTVDAVLRALGIEVTERGERGKS